MGTSDLSNEEPTAPAGRSWRRHSAEFKARVIELARQPSVSTAAVANGLNANMLRRWVREAKECVPSSAHKDTVTVTLNGATPDQMLCSEEGRRQVETLLERMRGGLPG